MKKSILKTGMFSTETYIDKETGEIISSNLKRHTYIANDREEFLLVYSTLLGIFMEMSQAEIRVYSYCLRFANGIKFDISKKVRINMSSEIGVNERTILNTIPLLLNKTLLVKDIAGMYQINPRYAFRGSTSDRNKELKAIIELGCKEC